MAMTEIDMNGGQYPFIQRFTLDGSTANKAHQVNVTSEMRTITVRFIGNDGKLAFQTTGDSIHASHIECKADTNNEFSLADGIGAAKGIGSFYVASAETSTVVVVMVEG
tara:strand:+ start:387 stop:713 length:327 start_codon:yes stop_codon:yes gene_type:complete